MQNSRLLWACVLLLSFIALAHASYPTRTPDLAPREAKSSSPPSSSSSSPSSTDNASDQPSVTAKPKTAAHTTGSSEAQTTDNAAASGTGTITGTKTGTRTKGIPLNSPPGGIDMKTPSIMDPMSYYPIGGQPITFGWNMTSILVSPTALNIEAYCSLNQRYYTIASNYSAQQTSVTWDTGHYQASATAPLAADIYTLYIYDSSKSRTAFPSPGNLAVFNNFRFGLYTPGSNIPLKDFHCDLCNDAAAIFSYHEVRIFLGTSFIFAVTMAWFIAGVAF